MINGMINIMLPGFKRYKSIIRPVILVGLLLCHFSVAYAARKENDFDIHVESRGSLLIIDSRVKLDATPEETWNVLTDFDHMTRFMSGLKISHIVSEPADQTVVVEQKGTLGYGPLAVSFESTKRNELVPFKSIRSSLVSGTFKHFESTTALTFDGEMTQIAYHAEVIPDTWLPAFIGSVLVRSEAKDKFEEFRAEILRRKQLGMAK